MKTKTLVTLFCICVAPTIHAQGDLRSAGRILTEGRRAADSGDVATYWTKTNEALKLVSPHPALYYHLARAAAMSGRTEEAFIALSRLKILGLPRDPAADSGFASIKSNPRFKLTLDSIAAASAPLIGGDTAFLVSLPNIVSENLAYDAVSKTFFVGSMAKQSILKVGRDGKATTFIEAEENIGQPLGMKVDNATRTLWVAAIWPIDSAGGRPIQRTQLLNVDLATGKIRHRYAPADSLKPHLLNDIVVLDGDLYISDSEGNAIWRLAKNSTTLEKWLDLPASTVYPNGITLSPDGRDVLVAHQTGLLGIDLRTKRVYDVAVPDAVTMMGIDGLYTLGSTVIGVQNSTPAHQIISAEIVRRPDGNTAVSCARILERKHPAYAIPTTGTLVGNDLYYIANSELRRLDPKGNLTDADKERQTVILRVPLSKTGKNSVPCVGQ